MVYCTVQYTYGILFTGRYVVMKESKAMSNTTRCFTCGDDGDCPDCDPRPAAQRKTIQFHQYEQDYDMFLDGRYVGTRATRKLAEKALDALAYEEARRS